MGECFFGAKLSQHPQKVLHSRTKQAPLGTGELPQDEIAGGLLG